MCTYVVLTAYSFLHIHYCYFYGKGNLISAISRYTRKSVHTILCVITSTHIYVVLVTIILI